MARQVLNAQKITRAGLNPTYTPIAQADGAAVNNNNGEYFVAVKNTTGAPINVIQKTNASVDGLGLPDQPAVAVPANGTILLGPWTAYPYNQANGQVYLNVSATGLEIAALTFSPNQ